MTTKKRDEGGERVTIEATRHMDLMNEGERAEVERELVQPLIDSGRVKVVDDGDPAGAGAPGSEPGGTGSDR